MKKKWNQLKRPYKRTYTRDTYWAGEGGDWDDYDWHSSKKKYVSSFNSMWGSFSWNKSDPDAMDNIIDMSLMDRVKFLVRLWSHSPNANVRTTNQASMDPSTGDENRWEVKFDTTRDVDIYTPYYTSPNQPSYDMRSSPFNDVNKYVGLGAEVPHTDIKTSTVTIPQFSLFYRKALKGNEKLKSTPYSIWRMLRFGSWHEAMHLLHTPHNWAGRCENEDISKQTYNLFEDYRINHVGIEEYPGMGAELDFLNRMINIGYEGLDDLLAVTLPPDQYFSLALSQRMNDGNIEPFNSPLVLNQEDIAFIDSVCERMEDDITESNTFRLAKETTDYMNRRFPQFNNGQSKSPMWNNLVKYMDDAKEGCDKGECPGDENGNGCGKEMKQQYEKLSEDMQEKARRILDHHNRVGSTPEIMRQRSAMGAIESKEHSDQISSEMKSCPVQFKQEMDSAMKDMNEAEKFGDVIRSRNSVMGEADFEFNHFVDREQVMKMVSYLRRWRDSMIECIDEYGSNLDVERMIVNELNQSPIDDFYISTTKNHPRENIIILLDTSGSISIFNDEYKTALATIMTALEMVKVNYAVYIFNTNFMDRGYIQRLKGFRNKRATNTEKRIVASIEATGGTPLAQSLCNLQKTEDWKRCKYLLTITDGETFVDEAFRKASAKMMTSRFDHMYLGIGTDKHSADNMKESLQRLVNGGVARKENITACTVKDMTKLVVNMVLRGNVV